MDKLLNILAKDIMTPHVKSVHERWTIQHFARFCSENDVSGSPVTDDEGNIVGIATLKDVADFHLNRDLEHESEPDDEDSKRAESIRQFLLEEMEKVPVEVRDIMTPSVQSVEETATLKQIAQTMMDEHIHRIFVCREDSVVGIITTYDLLKVFLQD